MEKVEMEQLKEESAGCGTSYGDTCEVDPQTMKPTC